MRFAVDDSLVRIEVIVFCEDSVALDLAVLELASVDKLVPEVIERPTSMRHCVKISLVVQLSWLVHDSLTFLVASGIPLAQVVLIIEPMFLEDMRGEELLVALHSAIRTLFRLELFKLLVELSVLGPGGRLVVGDSGGLDVLRDGRVGDGDVVADCTHKYSN